VNENKSLQWIAKELTRLNIPKDHRATTTPWHHAIVKRILSNRKYLGIWAWGQKRSERNPITGKIYYFPAPPEEIVQYTRHFPELRLIDDYLFAQAQELLKSRQGMQRWQNGTFRRYVRSQNKYLLTGLIKCGICGEMYQVGGKNSQYIFCPNRRHGGKCENRTQLPRVMAEKLILQEISQKILSNKLWINAIHSAVEEAIQMNTEGLSDKIKSKEHIIHNLRQKIEHILDQIENAVPIPELRHRLEKRTDELRQAELELRELRVRSGKIIHTPNRDWVLDKLNNLGDLTIGSIGAANSVLKKLLNIPISVVPIKVMGQKRCFLRGTVRLQAGKIATALTDIDTENKSDDFVEEFIINFKDTTHRDDRRRKVSDLHRNEGWSIKKISENVGISASYASKLLKEDYRIKGEQIPDFRCKMGFRLK
jgi:hypothetical protein